MKKLVKNRRIVLIGMLVAISIAIGVGTPAYARATVRKPIPWACINKDLSGLDIDLWTNEKPNEAWQIETPSGQVILIAHFDIPEEYRPDRVIKITGFTTNTWEGPSTDDTMIVLTPGGRSMLTAIVHP